MPPSGGYFYHFEKVIFMPMPVELMRQLDELHRSDSSGRNISNMQLAVDMDALFYAAKMRRVGLGPLSETVYPGSPGSDGNRGVFTQRTLKRMRWDKLGIAANKLGVVMEFLVDERQYLKRSEMTGYRLVCYAHRKGWKDLEGFLEITCGYHKSLHALLHGYGDKCQLYLSTLKQLCRVVDMPFIDLFKPYKRRDTETTAGSLFYNLAFMDNNDKAILAAVTRTLAAGKLDSEVIRDFNDIAHMWCKLRRKGVHENAEQESVGP